MITAKEAREISTSVYDIEREIEIVGDMIRDVATDGKRIFNYYGDICIESHKSPCPDHVIKFEESFRERGFEVQYRVDYSSLAKMWYEISW